MPADEKQYAAFISYRHVEPDRTWARWLHRALEGYRVPKSLVARGYPGRLGRVFRDEEELAAAPDLSAEVSRAVDASKHLIVVCSPETPSSRWVNEEVRRFHDLDRSNRVLALLIAGEPRDSFPPALRAIRPGADATHELSEREVEPLAADVRPMEGETVRSRRRTALLRTAAAMLGCSYDDLQRREQARRAARLRLVAAAALVSIGVLTGLVIWALREQTRANDAAALADARRIEAEESHAYEAGARADAEGLVEFMLTDLRKQLEAIGKLDVLRGVTERSLDYYTSLPSRHESDGAARRRASGLDTLGNALRAQGDLDGAIAAYKTSRETMKRLAEASPENMGWQHDLLICYMKAGDTHGVKGNLDEALDAYRNGLDIAKRLVAHDPENASWQRSLSYANNNVGDVHGKQRDWDDALAAHRESVKIRQRLVDASPTDARALSELGLAHGKVGNALQKGGEAEQAYEAYDAAFRTHEKAVQVDPDDPAKRAKLSSAYNNKAWALAELGRHDEAHAAHLESVKTVKRLIEHDETNLPWRDQLATSQWKLGQSYAGRKERKNAEAAYESALKNAKFVLERMPSSVASAKMVSVIRYSMALLAEEVGDLKTAVASMRAAVETIGAMVKHAPHLKSDYEFLSGKLKELQTKAAGSEQPAAK